MFCYKYLNDAHNLLKQGYFCWQLDQTFTTCASRIYVILIFLFAGQSYSFLSSKFCLYSVLHTRGYVAIQNHCVRTLHSYTIMVNETIVTVCQSAQDEIEKKYDMFPVLLLRIYRYSMTTKLRKCMVRHHVITGE